MTPEGKQVWVMNLLDNMKSQDFYLQPGSYRVVFRRADFKSTTFSLVRDFEVDPGSSESIEFY